jgi:hypothetical protein
MLNLTVCFKTALEVDLSGALLPVNQPPRQTRKLLAVSKFSKRHLY